MKKTMYLEKHAKYFTLLRWFVTDERRDLD